MEFGIRAQTICSSMVVARLRAQKACNRMAVRLLGPKSLMALSLDPLPVLKNSATNASQGWSQTGALLISRIKRSTLRSSEIAVRLVRLSRLDEAHRFGRLP